MGEAGVYRLQPQTGQRSSAAAEACRVAVGVVIVLSGARIDTFGDKCGSGRTFLLL